MLFGGIVLSGPTGRAGFVRVFLEGGGGDALKRGLGSSKFSRVVAKPLLAVGKAVDRPVRAGVNRLEDRWGRKGGGGVPSVCTWPIMGAIQPCGPNTEP